MQFKATDDQVKKIMALAVNASKPVGMGLLHATDKVFEPEEFNLDDQNRLDYVQGRMVKLDLDREENDIWFANKNAKFVNEPDIEYQSWKATYPTYGDLFKAAGVVEYQNS